MHRRSFAPSLVFIFVALAGCDDEPASHGRATYPGATWVVSTPEREGMDAEALAATPEYAFRSDRATQGVVVVRNGVIVGEWYDPTRDGTWDATSWSAGKSIASTLVGIAIDRGEVPGLSTSLATYFPTWSGTANEAITVRSLLEMRSGLPWDVTGYSDLDLTLYDGDRLVYSRDRTATSTPGTVWHYASGDSMLMAGVLEEATQTDVVSYAEEHLFGPIGMTAHWWTDQAGHAMTYCCVDATPREFARFGLLVTRGGRWNGRQVVSETWLEAATAPIAEMPSYGLQWWTFPGEFVVNDQPQRQFYAAGKDTQRIYSFPDLDLVIVRNGIYDRIGEGYVFGPAGFILTVAPADGAWDDVEFVLTVLRAIDPTADYVP